VLAIARELLAAARPTIEAQGITLMGITFGNLSDEDAVQLALPVDGVPARALDATIDDVRERYGSAAITRAVLLGRDQGLQVPLLPD
jgi:DNA polymerase-4